MSPNPLRAALAEMAGAATLSAAVIGSGIMAERLSSGNVSVALLANTGATVATLAVLINLLGPVSGAHFNPVVSLAMALRGISSWSQMGIYVIAQVAGCLAGMLMAHAMFDLPLIQVSTHARAGIGQWISELVATGGLLFVVLGHRRASDAPWLVAAWIGAAYWFTASTSFANPAITIARAFTDTFAGIRPADAPAFIVAQLIAGLFAVMVMRALAGQRQGHVSGVTEIAE